MEVAKTIRAIEDPKKRQEFANHHASIFSKQNPRFDAAKFHAAVGTKYSGSKLGKETGSIPSLPIQESLFDPASHAKVQRYADFMSNEPTYTKNTNVHGGPVEDLIEAGKMRDEAEKKFSHGKPEYDWDPVVDARTPGRRK